MARTLATWVVLAVGLAGPSSTARADGPFEGVWTAGPTRVQVDVRSWGRDCGPQPRSTTVPSPGNVRISQSGDHLTFHGRRTQRTDQCWSENRAVRRVSASHQSGVWRTVCRTPEADSRSETGTYTLRASGGDRLEFVDVSRYDWQLNESRCFATITARQVFTRVSGGSSEPEPRPEPEPEPEPERRCTPGAPARVMVRPASATIEPGEQVRLRARVVDSGGCPVPGRRVRWDLRRPDGVAGTLDDGVFTAASTAAEAEGEFSVVARSGDLTGRATVVVRTADLSDLIAKRTSGGLVQASDDEETATGQSAAGVVARSEQGEGGSLLWPIIGVAAALIVLGGAMLLLLGSRRRRQPPPSDSAFEEDPPAAAAAERMPVASAHIPGAGRACPVCHQEFSDPSVGFCPADGAKLVDPGAVGSSQALICPTCRRGFGEGMARCPTDGDELIPYAVFVERHQQQQAGGGERTKICPQCGDRYALTVTFCGKDGAELVLVN